MDTINAQILDFLRELRAHNDRIWFQANKGRYDMLRLVFIEETQELINRLSLFDPEIANLEAKDCIYRIYRDLRFSPDKTPYKCHFAAYIALGGKSSLRGGYYLHIEPGGCLLAGGVWCPPPPLLKRLRKDIYDHIEEMEAIMEDPAFKNVYPGLESEMLKRMPIGFPVDTPYGHVLRHKDFTVVSRKPDAYFTASDWMEHTVNDFKLLCPFNNFLNYTVDEYLGRI